VSLLNLSPTHKGDLETHIIYKEPGAKGICKNSENRRRYIMIKYLVHQYVYGEYFGKRFATDFKIELLGFNL